ncbi:hypothetical protein N7495_003422 [Penicillium taxi]|uniref:uncharacterized protein n=1 Tax=Penicillium taxi TaxID=168475 RepID=UPI002545727E|nr:uncharacterized protein N7495_003422 [Penicillium taxi]KAJ5902894.1 hypothetical protein N7495_003422 [Penicillium taxi]
MAKNGDHLSLDNAISSSIFQSDQVVNELLSDYSLYIDDLKQLLAVHQRYTRNGSHTDLQTLEETGILPLLRCSL